jgi:hypothetical protein
MAQRETGPNAPANYRRLTLGAEDSDDLAVISAVVQDATIRVADLAWQKRRRRFVLMLNRFIWEDHVGAGARVERRWFRVRSGLHFDGVLSVAASGLDPSRRDDVLDLLALTHEGAGDGAGTITLVFAGNAAIRLSVECIDCYLRDLSAPWPTANLPAHDLGPDGPGPARDEG